MLLLRNVWTKSFSKVATRDILLKKALLKFSQNLQGNTCVGVSIVIKFIKKKTPAHVFSSEFWEIFKNTFFTEHLRATAPAFQKVAV